MGEKQVRWASPPSQQKPRPPVISLIKMQSWGAACPGGPASLELQRNGFTPASDCAHASILVSVLFIFFPMNSAPSQKNGSKCIA